MVSHMRHAILKKRARIIDLVIDQYKQIRGRKTFPKIIVAGLVGLMFPDSDFEGRGFFKEGHSVHSRTRKLVLELSHAPSTKRDWQVYRRLPKERLRLPVCVVVRFPDAAFDGQN
jgi:hypothetical protein